MTVEHPAPDVHVLRGQTYDANATVLVNGGRALMVDGMASHEDARALRAYVTGELGKDVRFLVSTHYFSDHLAALSHFPEAEIVAHELYRHTFDSENHRSDEERAFFVKPTILVREGMTMAWGRFTLDLFHNPGHTLSTLAIDVPEADLLFTGDTVVGNIVYLAYSTPELMAAALTRCARRGRGRLLASHGGVVPGTAIAHAHHYLDALGAAVGEAGSDEVVRAITLERCLAPGLSPSDYERLYHGRNLETIVERRLFS